MKKITILIFAILIVVSCQNSEQRNHVAIDKLSKIKDSVFVLSNVKQNSEAVFLFNNGQQIIINWTVWDAHNKKHNLLEYAYFNKTKLHFDRIQTVPDSKGLQMHAESMAKVGVKPDGTLLAVYRKKSDNDRSRFGGHLYYNISTDHGKTWSRTHKLVSDTTSSSQSFYDIAILPNQQLGMTWLDSRSKRRGKTLYFAQTDSASIFSKQKPIAFSTCECCRTELFVDNRGMIHAAYRNLIEPDEEGFNGVSDIEIRDMYYLKSVDTAQTFSKPIAISKDNWHVFGCPHTGPSLAFNGELLGAIWFTGVPNSTGLFFTTSLNKTFAPRKNISSEGRHPQMISIQSKFYSVYEEYHEKQGKGYYKIVLDIIEANGKHQMHEISIKNTNNNHPVITNIDEHTLLIAWVNTDTRNPKIVYKIINPDNL